MMLHILALRLVFGVLYLTSLAYAGTTAITYTLSIRTDIGSQVAAQVPTGTALPHKSDIPLAPGEKQNKQFDLRYLAAILVPPVVLITAYFLIRIRQRSNESRQDQQSDEPGTPPMIEQARERRQDGQRVNGQWESPSSYDAVTHNEREQRHELPAFSFAELDSTEIRLGLFDQPSAATAQKS